MTGCTCTDAFSKFSASVPRMNFLGECEVMTGVRNTAGGNSSPSLPDLLPPTPASVPVMVPTQGFAWPEVQSREPFSAEPALPTRLVLASLISPTA